MHYFVDESGSMDKLKPPHEKHFIICLIRVLDESRLKVIFKRFISANLLDLKRMDLNNKMFIKNKFKELKGSALTFHMKEKLVYYLTQSRLFEIYYVNLDNSSVDSYMYRNNARAFNFSIKSMFLNAIKYNKLPNNEYLFLDIDERNVATESKNSLEDYLNIELILNEQLISGAKVNYYDSSQNTLIQLADFFSNFYYSYLYDSRKYKYMYNYLYSKNFIKYIMYYPYNKNSISS